MDAKEIHDLTDIIIRWARTAVNVKIIAGADDEYRARLLEFLHSTKDPYELDAEQANEIISNNLGVEYNENSSIRALAKVWFGNKISGMTMREFIMKALNDGRV